MIQTIIDLPVFKDIKTAIKRDSNAIHTGTTKERTEIEKELEKNILDFILECLHYLYDSEYILKHSVIYEVHNKQINRKSIFIPIDGEKIQLVYSDSAGANINGMHLLCDYETNTEAVLLLFYKKYFDFILNSGVKDTYRLNIYDNNKKIQTFLFVPFLLFFPVNANFQNYLNDYRRVIAQNDYTIIDSMFFEKKYNIKILLYFMMYLFNDLDNFDKKIYDNIIPEFTNINNIVVENQINLSEFFLFFTPDTIKNSVINFIYKKTNDNQSYDVDVLATILAFFSFLVNMANDNINKHYKMLIQSRKDKFIMFYRYA